MSDNIVGKDHLDYVKSQISARQEILGKFNKDSEDIVWQDNRNSWIRLMSSVDIADEQVLKFNETIKEDQLVSNNGAEFRNQYLGLEGYGGPKLAQELILQGGTLNYNEPKFGVTDNISTSPESNFNYGFGGNQFGQKPMPGITSFSSNTYNKGSLRKAQLQIIAHNTQQFNYIESTYLRLGYTMLLEWGNTKYPITNEDGSIRYSTPSDIAALSLKDEFLYSYDKGSSYFYTRIEELRKTSQGNYDGFLGRVENFSWEFTKEGSYSITLDLISIGSVVESLKINTNLNSVNYTLYTGSLNSNPDNDRPSALETAIDLLTNTQTQKNTTTKSGVTAGGPVLVGAGIKSEVVAEPIKRELSELEAKDLGTGRYFYEDIIDIIATTSSTGENTNTVQTRVISCNAGFGKENFSYKYYVRLGSLIGFINEKLLVYNTNSTPNLIEIDGNIDTFCYSNGVSFSGDPTKMVNKLNITVDSINLKAFEYIEPFHDTLEDGTQVGRVMNLYFEREYLKSVIRNNLDELDYLTLYDFLKELVNEINPLLGGVNKLNLRIVQKDLGEGIIKEVLEIYDEVPFKKINTNPIFNIYGFNPNESKNIKDEIVINDETGETQTFDSSLKYNGGSFITDFNLKTEITKKMSTQIAIGAQANGRSVGEDATLFSKWNIGLIDRVIPFKLDIDKAKADTAQSRVDFYKLRDTYKKYLLQFRDSGIVDFSVKESNSTFSFTSVDDFSGYGFPNLYLTTTKDDKPTFTKFLTIQKEFFRKALSYDAERKGISTPFVGFIPINLSLTMDGLSGIRIFDKLTVNSKFLPSNYTETLDFIITQLDHKFEGEKWITNIGTLSMPKLFTDKRVEIPLDVITEEDFEREDISSIDINNYFYTDHPAILGRPAGGVRAKARKVTVEEILKGINGSPEVQSKFRLLLNYFQNDLQGGRGIEIRINSAYRNIENSFNVYTSGTVDQRLKRTIRSPHFWGLALDIELVEATPNGGGNNILAGQGERFVDTWRTLGVVDYATSVAKLRWGGTFKSVDSNGNIIPYYDCVHFDALPSTQYTWAGNGMATTAQEFIRTAYPNLRNLVYLSTIGKGLENAKNLQYWFADILDTRNIILLSNGTVNYDTSRALYRDSREYSFLEESKYTSTQIVISGR